MDESEQIVKFQRFFEQYYYADLLEKARKGEKVLVVDFDLLSQFDLTLAELLLEEPEDIIQTAMLAVEQFDMQGDVKNFTVRFKNLPASQRTLVSNIRSKHLTKLIWMNGVVRQKSDVRPQVTSSKFECPVCGAIMNVLQLDTKFKEPSKCSCGRKGRFHLLSKELVDVQSLTLEEATEELEGGEQPKRIKVFLKNDMVSPLSEKKTNPGTKVSVSGIVKEVPITLKSGGQSTRFDILLEANFIEPVQEEFLDLNVSPEELQEIRTLSEDPKLTQKLVQSIAPSIYGHDVIKEALIFQLMGGVRKTRDSGAISRGDIHILLIGDPGSGKSQLLKRISKVAPKARYVSGKGASGAGLTAAVVKDEFLQGYSLEAGALVLANRGICLTGDTEVRLADGERRMEELYGRIIGGEAVNILCMNYDTLKFQESPVKGISRRMGRTSKITLESGDLLKITDEHPMLVWDNGYYWKEAKEVQVGDYVITKRKFPTTLKQPYVAEIVEDNIFAKINLDDTFPGISRSEIAKVLLIPKHRLEPKNKIKIKDIKHICSHLGIRFEDIQSRITIEDLPKKVTPELGEFLGLIMTDGHLSNKKYNIVFYNKSQDILARFVHLAKELFGVKVSSYIDTRNNTEMKYFGSQTVHGLLRSFGIVAGNKSTRPMDLRKIRLMPSDVIHAFIGGVISGDGCVCQRETGGIIEIVSGNRETMEELRKCARTVGILGRVINIVSKGGGLVSRKKRMLYGLTITGVDNFKLIKGEYITKTKAEKLERCKQSRDLSTKIPKVDKIIAALNAKIPHTEKRVLYKNSIKTSTLANSRISRDALQRAVGELAEMNPARNTQEFKLLRCLLEEDMIFLKVIDKQDNGEQMVYNLQADMPANPNFFANCIPVHNCLIDELDKMSKEDRSAMHEALEQQTVSISKANIQATLTSETTVLAAANPKFGRFDPYGNIAEQIDLPSTLINRFDLIFPIRDLPDEDKDLKMARFILNLHQSPDMEEPEIPTNMIRKYIAYARQHIKPRLTEAAMEEIQLYYLKMRSSGNQEGAVKSIPISPRQLEGLIRLSEAAARVRLSDKVTKKDARKAIELLDYCLRQIALDEETGTIDIDRIATGITASQRTKIVSIKEIIVELEGKLGKVIPIEDVMRLAVEKGIDESDVDTAIDRLRRSGDVFEPKRGFISRI